MQRLKLHPGLCLGLLGMVALPSLSLGQTSAGQAGPSQPTADAGSTATHASDAVAPIAALYSRLTQVEQAHGTFAQRAQLLAPTVDQVFNLQTVLQNSLGLRYHTLPDSQKQQLLEQFRQFTVARYVSNFASGGTDQFTVDPAVTPSPLPGDQIVHSHIKAGGSITDVNYVMRQTPGAGGGWQVVDVLLNGNISQVAVQRADFGSSLTSGDATSLIDSLRKKTQAFSES